MNITKKDLWFFAICSFLTVITTLGIHSGIFDFETTNIIEQVGLYKNSIYNLGFWWIIAHCLLVLCSMWGVFLIQYKKTLTLIGLGFLSYAVFCFTEIFRQLLYLFYLNGQFKRYAFADNDELRDSIFQEIQSFSLISYSLFGLFIFAFALGNLCYGLSLVRGSKWDKLLGYILLIWGIQGLLTLGNEFWEINWMGILIGKFSLVCQPFARLLIGLWFLNLVYELQKLKLKNNV
tara:strand:+ start:38248 stop:38949 length:702 start_codon:yes stop_codon:yes gene_type:complete